MKKYKLFAILLIATFVLCACSDDSGSKVREVKGVAHMDNQWTYINLELGKTVGYSSFGDEKQDAQWAERMDWDIAICGKYIRTNGGTSGKGNAAIAINPVPYEMAGRSEVEADVDTVEVWED